MMRIPAVWVLVALVCLVPVPPAVAQEMTAPSTTVTLVATSQLPENARTMVLLRRQAQPREVILVDVAHATAADLGAALAQLATLRARFGDVPETDVHSLATSFRPARDFAATDGPRLDRYLRNLRAAPVRTLESLGSAPALPVNVPALAVRRVPPGH